MPDAARAHVIYSGTVHGVGFRYTTIHLAAARPVTGYVRNLPDGTVELLAEGRQTDLHDLISEIARTMSRYIADSTVTWSPATGAFTRFEIRH